MKEQAIYEYKCPKCGYVNKRVYKAERIICDKCYETFAVKGEDNA